MVVGVRERPQRQEPQVERLDEVVAKLQEKHQSFDTAFDVLGLFATFYICLQMVFSPPVKS